MNFKELACKLRVELPNIKVVIPEGWADRDKAEIGALVSDSREVCPGAMFACVRGEHVDGHDFAAEAKSAGAVALLCERKIDTELPQIICDDARRAMGKAASVLYGYPSSKMKMVALTGTNGKTTSAFMIRSILEFTGVKTGLLGTIYCYDGKTKTDAEHTTPEGSDLQFQLSRMVKNGCKACVMEASSHAIDQGRIDGIKFDRAGFTNLTPEHLDYHKSMEGYFEAKRKLFFDYMRGDWAASINIDDKWGRRLYEELQDRAVSYGTESSDADFRAGIKSVSKEGTGMELCGKSLSGKLRFRLPMLGTYNVLNALQAISICHTLGIAAEDSVEALKTMEQVPGRLERVVIKGYGTCIIDFAHSSDGLEKVLTALRPVCEGRLIVAFGAGGDRDRSKRFPMGEIASRIADYVIVTSDNPRTEDPELIVREIETGVKEHGTDYEVITDRKEAVFEGLSMLKERDIFLLAGRGPERYQILKDGPIPLMDKDIVLEWAKTAGKEVL